MKSESVVNKTVVLEGFHVCKHAVRFGADITELVTADKDILSSMLENSASDISKQVLDQVREISQTDFDNYSNVQIRTPLAGKATVPGDSWRLNLQEEEGLVVVLENPRDLENIGAVVRLCAGMNVAGMVTTGDVDPWHKNCLRGSQGLHFALPIYNYATLSDVGLRSLRKEVYVFDESGEDITGIHIPGDAVLVFGSERHGVSKETLAQADKVVRIPQKEDVSSYNLATSVAMGVYAAKYQ